MIIFLADDVGQKQVLVAVAYHPDADPRNGGLDRDPGVHQRQGAAADGGHRRRTVRLEHVGDDSNGVWEIGGVGQHGLDALFGQGAVPDLAPSGAANRTNLADGERREVIMKHESLFVFLKEPVDDLHIPRCA